MDVHKVIDQGQWLTEWLARMVSKVETSSRAVCVLVFSCGVQSRQERAWQCRPRSNSALPTCIPSIIVPAGSATPPAPRACSRTTPMSRLLSDSDLDTSSGSIGPDQFVQLFYRSTALSPGADLLLPPRRVSLTYLHTHSHAITCRLTVQTCSVITCSVCFNFTARLVISQVLLNPR